MGRAEAPRKGELFFAHIYGHDRIGIDNARRRNRTEADTAGAEYGYRLAGPAPVMTAQPMIAVTSVGTSLGSATTTRSDAKAYSAQVAAE